jgi:EpsI family protein
MPTEQQPIEHQTTEHRANEGRTSSPGYSARPALAVGMLLVCGVALNTRSALQAAPTSLPKLQAVPMAAMQWQGPLPAAAPWSPSFERASDARRLRYVAATESAPAVEVYLNVYGPQQQGSELVFFSNTVSAPGHWQTVGGRGALAFGQPAWTEQLQGDQRWLIGHLYVVGGHRTTSGLLAQLLYGIGTLVRPPPAGVVALAVQCQADCSAQYAQLEDFWGQLGDALVAAIPTKMELGS